ncbi:hypothetical protein [Allostreptomyces psammosilenae]|uniref:Uncharacterized protein n=1 Tax=Allostreptomyces psammosilenae TaxID=1892865 RepID=A0A853A020_9ACTN|nr:hypothetical protein [Allostreptomyces psammosilenae]NYI04171.1 hypothetical protein [Allostreptomyces psammosilenae]
MRRDDEPGGDARSPQEQEQEREREPERRDRAEGAAAEEPPRSAVSGGFLHNMGGDMGDAQMVRPNAPGDSARPDAPGRGGERRAEPSPIGVSGTPNVAGGDDEQQERAGSAGQGPDPAMLAREDEERTGRPVGREIDPGDRETGRGADGETEARLRQKREGGP